jgi:hypothetical protein
MLAARLTPQKVDAGRVGRSEPGGVRVEPVSIWAIAGNGAQQKNGQEE